MRGQPALMDDMTWIAWLVVGLVVAGLVGLIMLAIWWENRRVYTTPRKDPVTGAVSGGASTGHGSKGAAV
jgi:hypothetical protein